MIPIILMPGCLSLPMNAITFWLILLVLTADLDPLLLPLTPLIGDADASDSDSDASHIDSVEFC